MPLVTGGSGVPSLGVPQLVYRYTVASVDKTSIDTGVDTPDAGSNIWTGGDLLEVFLYLRTDDAGATGTFLVRLNNDSGANYDRQDVHGSSATAAAFSSLGATSIAANCPGTAATANFFGATQFNIPNYAGTTGYKQGLWYNSAITDGTTATNNSAGMQATQYRSTLAISRLLVGAFTGGQKLKVGSQLLIYKRLST